MRLNYTKANAQKIMMFVVVIAVIASCRDARPNSRVKIDSGEFIHKDSANKVEGVFSSLTKIPGASSGGGCTGTAVSTTTAMTAGHCVYDSGDKVDREGLISGKEYCISNAIYQKLCSTEIYVNPTYIPNSHDASGGHDFAYVVFPEGTFKSYFRMNTSPLLVGDEVLLVGYSEAKLNQTGKGSKRFGYNKIQEFWRDDRSDIITNFGGTFQNVAVSPGDSGGPIMKACQVTGVASRMTGEASKRSIHTNLTDLETVATLTASKKGYFCGLSGNDEKYCPKNTVFTPKQSATIENKEFPCEVQDGGNQTQPDPQQSTGTIYAALNDSNDLFIVGSEELTSVEGCFGKTLELAKSCDTKLTISQDGSKFKTRLALDAGTSEYYVKLNGVKKSNSEKIEQLLKLRKK